MADQRVYFRQTFNNEAAHLMDRQKQCSHGTCRVTLRLALVGCANDEARTFGDLDWDAF